jgi:hypothetical protein
MQKAPGVSAAGVRRESLASMVALHEWYDFFVSDGVGPGVRPPFFPTFSRAGRHAAAFASCRVGSWRGRSAFSGVRPLR